MNGKTATLINKMSKMMGINPKDLKREYNRLNGVRRAKFRAHMKKTIEQVGEADAKSRK